MALPECVMVATFYGSERASCGSAVSLDNSTFLEQTSITVSLLLDTDRRPQT